MSEWTHNDLAAIIRGEYQDRDVKSCKNSNNGSSLLGTDPFKKMLLKAASAFANTDGGYLILGVDDSSQVVTRASAAPLTHAGGTKEWLGRIIAGNSSPPILDFDIEAFDDTRLPGTSLDKDEGVLVIHFRPSFTVHQSKVDYFFYVRSSDNSVHAEGSLVVALANRRRSPLLDLVPELSLGGGGTHQGMPLDKQFNLDCTIVNTGIIPSASTAIHLSIGEKFRVDRVRPLQLSEEGFDHAWLEKGKSGEYVKYLRNPVLPGQKLKLPRMGIGRLPCERVYALLCGDGVIGTISVYADCAGVVTRPLCVKDDGRLVSDLNEFLRNCS